MTFFTFVHGILLLFVLMVIPLTKQSDGIYTSIYRLRTAMVLSGTVLKLFTDHYGQKQFPHFNRFYEHLHEQYDTILHDVDAAVGNPLQVYHFVRLFAEDWSSALEDYKQLARREEFEEISTLKDYLPSEDDLKGVFDGIARLQGIYNISAEEITEGYLAGFTVGKLTAFECFELGKFMCESGYRRLGLEWYMAALNMLHSTGQQTTETCSSDMCDDKLSEIIREALHDGQRQGDALWLTDQTTIGDKTRHITPLHVEQDVELNSSKKFHYGEITLLQKEREKSENIQQALEDLSFIINGVNEENMGEELKKLILNKEIKYTGKEMYRNIPEYRLYETLCREGSLQADHLKGVNYECYLINNNHPLLLLRPIKVEILSFYPHIYKYHDILTEFEMEYMKRQTSEFLETAEINIVGQEVRNLASRVSSGFGVDEQPKVMERINNRLQATTGLLTKEPSAEHFQVANYGIGGQYVPHTDSFHPDARPILENRLATILFYLSDVTAGGATVFIDARLKVPPQKGSAVFWFNFDNDLNPDSTSIHAGCPVIIGSKWIANKWIHIKNQNLQCHIS